MGVVGFGRALVVGVDGEDFGGGLEVGGGAADLDRGVGLDGGDEVVEFKIAEGPVTGHDGIPASAQGGGLGVGGRDQGFQIAAGAASDVSLDDEVGVVVEVEHLRQLLPRIPPRPDGVHHVADAFTLDPDVSVFVVAAQAVETGVPAKEPSRGDRGDGDARGWFDEDRGKGLESGDEFDATDPVVDGDHEVRW